MWLFDCTQWSSVRCVNAPTTTKLPTTVGTFHGSKCFSHMICTLQISTYQIMARLFSHFSITWLAKFSRFYFWLLLDYFLIWVDESFDMLNVTETESKIKYYKNFFCFFTARLEWHSCFFQGICLEKQRFPEEIWRSLFILFFMIVNQFHVRPVNDQWTKLILKTLKSKKNWPTSSAAAAEQK